MGFKPPYQFWLHPADYMSSLFCLYGSTSIQLFLRFSNPNPDLVSAVYVAKVENLLGKVNSFVADHEK